MSTRVASFLPQPRPLSLVAATRRVLEMIAARASLRDILTTLCTALDEQYPDMMAMAMRVDPDGRRLWPVAAPRVPAAWIQAISPVEIGPGMGPCGTAAFLKQRGGFLRAAIRQKCVRVKNVRIAQQ